MADFVRSSGILLHPTSLPGPYGIGDLGPQAYRWVDFLSRAGCALWQVLPLGPTGYGDSPYQCFSAFAGNPYLISPDLLVQAGWLTAEDLAELPAFPAERVDFGAVIPFKLALLARAFSRFQEHATVQQHAAVEAFRRAQGDWLEDYALFMALKQVHDGRPWVAWDAPLRRRDPAALQQFAARHRRLVEQQIFWQYLFFDQWRALRAYARQKGVRIIGDLPIFVAHDSADVWQRPGLFWLDEEGYPTVVAGVPPDYFSPTGQRWGNPLYRWERHAEEGYAWWLARFRTLLEQVDFVRLDHFRGFAACWEVPAGEETAVNGRWVSGPGAAFFEAVRQALGDLPLIAEDLGEITPDVISLRERFGLPGMKILVFAFDGNPHNPFLPHNFVPRCVVYTGTHDNDTVVAWYQAADEGARDFARRYLATDGREIAWDFLRAAWASVAVFAIAQMQDVLGLDNRARMNYPSRLGGNWEWRMRALPGDDIAQRLKEINGLYGRLA